MFRKNRGITQELLAEKIGISRKLVTDYETGRLHMNEQMLVRFSLALDVPSDELLGLEDKNLGQDSPSLRFTRRIRELEALPEAKKKVILQLLDDLIRANS